MPNVTYRSVTYRLANGSRRTFDIPDGVSVMQGAVTNGVDGILGECGGNAMCATCHVYVDPSQLDRLPAMEAGEDALLDGTASERRPNSRLGCQIAVTAALEGLIVELPDRQI